MGGLRGGGRGFRWWTSGLLKGSLRAALRPLVGEAPPELRAQGFKVPHSINYRASHVI